MITKLNKSDYLILSTYYVVAIVINFFDYHERHALLREYFIDFSMDIGVSILLIIITINWTIPKFLIHKKNYFLFAFWGILIMIIIGFIDYTVGFWTGDNDWSKFPKGIKMILISISNSANLMGLPMGFLLTKKFYENQFLIHKIEKQQKENELKLLRSQLDPHFLFNNLNTLDALIDSNPIKAKEYINRLSLIYRYLIQTKDSEIMELTEEINLAENYIFLIKTRFGDDYNFVIKQDSIILDKFIPTGAIQTLLENVVKHNKAIDGKSITTIIDVTDEWLTITNVKSKTSNSDSLGTGLNNLKSRYKLLSNKTIKITETNKEFRISIPIIKLITE